MWERPFFPGLMWWFWVLVVVFESSFIICNCPLYYYVFYYQEKSWNFIGDICLFPSFNTSWSSFNKRGWKTNPTHFKDYVKFRGKTLLFSVYKIITYFYFLWFNENLCSILWKNHWNKNHNTVLFNEKEGTSQEKKTFIINKFPSNTAQYFFNQLTDHSPYIDLLFTWICKIMQLLLIRKFGVYRIQESTEINNPFIAIIVYLSRQKSKWTDSAWNFC